MRLIFTVFLLLVSVQANAVLILNVDYADYFDGDALTNSISFTGIDGAFASSNVAYTTNFPIIYLDSFFNSDQYFGGETVATSEGLTDKGGRSYGRAIDGARYSNIPTRPQDSIGFLATNRAVQSFSTTQTALTGTSIFDFTGFSFASSNFHAGGDLYANYGDGLNGYVLIGQWAAITSSVPEPATLALMGLGIVGLGFSRRNKS